MFKMGTDVVLVFADGEIASSRCFLSQVSPVFAKMFFGPMPMAESINGRVEMISHSKESMELVLEAMGRALCMQNDSLFEKLTLENVRPIMLMLHEFQIEPSLFICDTFLQTKTLSATAEDAMFAQTFHLPKFFAIAVKHLMKKKMLAAFVSENGETLTVDSWKRITQCQSAEYDKFVELKKAAKDVMAIFQSHAYQDKKIKQICNGGDEVADRVDELKKSLAVCK